MVERVREWHQTDLAAGCGEAPLPNALTRKYANAGREWGWQYVFPAGKVAVDPAGGLPGAPVCTRCATALPLTC